MQTFTALSGSVRGGISRPVCGGREGKREGGRGRGREGKREGGEEGGRGRGREGKREGGEEGGKEREVSIDQLFLCTPDSNAQQLQCYFMEDLPLLSFSA